MGGDNQRVTWFLIIISICKILALCVGVSSAASISSTPNPIGAQALHLSSPTQAHLSLGQLNLIAPQQHSNVSQRIQSTVAPTVEIPSQPQPQMRAGQQPLVSSGEYLNLFIIC